jgi:hypothetical protein
MGQKKAVILIICTIMIMLLSELSSASNTIRHLDDNERESIFVGQNMHLAGREVVSHQINTEKGPGHILVFPKGFSMLFGANKFSSDSAVVWLISVMTRPGGSVLDGYEVKMYLHGNVSAEDAKNAEAIAFKWVLTERGRAVVARFGFRGEAFVTAEKRETVDPRGLELYVEAFAAVGPVEPQFKPNLELPAEGLEFEESVIIMPVEEEPRFTYPISPVGEATPQLSFDPKANIATVIGRFYIGQKQGESGRLLELQADNAVIFFAEQDDKETSGTGSIKDFLAAGKVQAIYLSGDVLMTREHRTIRADEMYYDFSRNQALAINAVQRTFDPSRGIPIYIRAAKLRQVAEDKFAAENITLTTSEFYLPQLSVNASQVKITDTTPVDEQTGRLSDDSFYAEMWDVRFKWYNKTFFRWPYVQGNLQRPDIPLKSISTRRDKTWGTSIETQWYLARLLGLQEPKGTNGTFALDYYSKRGIGSGINIDYQKENSYGRILSYVIKDHGKDRLGRAGGRKDIEPPRDLRGRFRWQHRQFLPYDWQLTTELSYISDKNFIEQFCRTEFNTDKGQETLIHLKRTKNNWALAFLGKVRLNDFRSDLEELPTAEFHWTGQSFFNDRLTFYSDNQFSQFRQRYGYSTTALKDFFIFSSTRNEVDMPMTFGRSKVVPFLAGTIGYEDGSGFRTGIDGLTKPAETTVWLGETGVRATTHPFWKIYPNVQSQLWDLKGLRHIISPHFTAVAYTQNKSVFEQRDTLNMGLSQRLQTKRGIGPRRTPSRSESLFESGFRDRRQSNRDKDGIVDWMRLDTDVTWINNSSNPSSAGPGPDRFIWNKPFIPIINRRSSNIFGPRRNYVSADYTWNLSDTTALLSDMNFDLQSGVAQQFNIGVSALRWPNLTYYIGNRYLRRLVNGYGEKGSNAFILAGTYVLDPRYAVVFSQQNDFDYGVNVRSEISVVRRYHRINLALTYSVDESMDDRSIVFSIWPEGLEELAFGKRHMNIGSSADY